MNHVLKAFHRNILRFIDTGRKPKYQSRFKLYLNILINNFNKINTKEYGKH